MLMEYASRHDYRSVASKIDAELYKETYDFWLQQATAVNAATGANQTFTLQPIPYELAEIGEAKGGNCMGIPQENQQCKSHVLLWRILLWHMHIPAIHTNYENQIGWTTLVDWENAADDDTVRNVSISTTEQWQKLGQERGTYVDYLYQNDASRDQNPLAKYGDANIARLREISAKYDPSQVFQKLQNDGFLLRKV